MSLRAVMTNRHLPNAAPAPLAHQPACHSLCLVRDEHLGREEQGGD
jgi:hypothetical protein